MQKEKMIKFTCEGGYDGEKEHAKKAFQIGKEYKVVGGVIGSFSTHLVIEDVPGTWNSCLFDCDIFELEELGILQNGYRARNN
jgi:hypothetical protein